VLNVVRYSSTASDARRLVLVHGFTQNGAVWDSIAKELCEDFEVWTVDLPGHGATDPEHDGADLWVAAQLLVETCGTADYVGYSQGARVVLHAAVGYPNEVRSAVLAGGKAGYRHEAERYERHWNDANVAARIDAGGQAGLPDFIDEWLAQPFNARLEPKTRFRELRLKNRAHGLAESMRHCGLGVQESLWDRVSELRMPVLLVRGQYDLPGVADDNAEMDRIIGDNASMIVIDGAGHASPFEDPTGFARIVKNFLT
jgi:2-succinyl-6-hydroxy-2,4-cyclohexadiene-1-carboxylate synthase